MPELTALVLNCTLSPSPAPSSTDLLAGQLLDQLSTHGVTGSTVRVVDHDVRPGVELDMGDGDAWPTIREQVMAAAETTARRLVDLQGTDGQWWWHYDTRDGQVVEGYPVYSVHQHAMAPMALLDLLDAGGVDYRAALAKGLRWIDNRPETKQPMVSEADGTIWRKVGRSEPSKLARKLGAFTTAVSPGLHVPYIDCFPAGFSSVGVVGEMEKCMHCTWTSVLMRSKEYG